MGNLNQKSTYNMVVNNYAIIVAGGSGSRMQSTIPKQFLLLNGKPVLMHTLNAFYNSYSKPKIILVLPSNSKTYWEELCKEYSFTIPHTIIIGGENRFHSVKNGLESIKNLENTVIAVHDAVRPSISIEIIDQSYNHAAENGNAVAAVKSRDSIRQLRNGTSTHLIRDEIYLIQTPQTFKAEQLLVAYNQSYNANFTDDASVVEHAGFKINLIEGSYTNIKITFPEDIAIAELLMQKI